LAGEDKRQGTPERRVRTRQRHKIQKQFVLYGKPADVRRRWSKKNKIETDERQD
jgi:hypothetical protein